MTSSAVEHQATELGLPLEDQVGKLVDAVALDAAVQLRQCVTACSLSFMRKVYCTSHPTIARRDDVKRAEHQATELCLPLEDQVGQLVDAVALYAAVQLRQSMLDRQQ